MHWTPYRRLAFAVLESAVCDALAGDSDARHFLASNRPTLHHWCELVGMPVARVRRGALDPEMPAWLAAVRSLLTAERVSARTAPASSAPPRQPPVPR